MATYIGGTDKDSASGVAVDNQGNIYVVGGTRSEDFPLTRPDTDRLPSWLPDGYVVRLASNGSLLLSFLFGGSGTDGIADIIIQEGGLAYVVGSTTSTNLPVTGGYDSTFNGIVDAFLAKLLVPGTLRGLFVGPDGQPLGNVTVTIVDQSGEVVDTFLTDSNGSFHLVLDFGTYSLKANATGYQDLVIDGIEIAPGSPDVDLGEIGLSQVPTPPYLLSGLVWILPAVVVVAVLMFFLLRRRAEK
jgi:hypothetical protein